MKNVGVIIVALVLAVGLGIWATKHPPKINLKPSLSGTLHEVAYVYDGDTIKLDNGERVRLIGIDSPESHNNPKLVRDVNKRHSDRETQLALGKKAGMYVKDFLRGQHVRLEYDVEQHDRYGRTLAYVYMSDGTFVNQKIIEDGYAYPLTIPPNVRYAHLFKQWFDESREQKRGLWQ